MIVGMILVISGCPGCSSEKLRPATCVKIVQQEFWQANLAGKIFYVCSYSYSTQDCC